MKRTQPVQSQNSTLGGPNSEIISHPLSKMKEEGVFQNYQLKNPYEFIEEVPQILLTIEQMNSDPIRLMCELEAKYAEYGAVKLTVCDEWKHDFRFPKHNYPIKTRKQYLQDLTLGKVRFFYSFPWEGFIYFLFITQPFEECENSLTIAQYQKDSQKFSQDYKYVTSPTGTTPEAINENEYWNLVTNQLYSKNRISVTYAADLSSSRHGSGFPTVTLENEDADCHFNYSYNFFNLNNLYKSPYSLLRILKQKNIQISGISQPWVYLGMLFTTFCWHVQDLFLNSVNYNHSGKTKTWYVVPGKDKQRFDKYVKEKNSANGQKKKLEHMTLIINPLELIQAGIKVYKVHQRPKNYVLTFFKAYHAGFNHGYNVCEAVNFISYESINIMRQAFRHYQQQEKMKAQVLSFDWLVYDNIVQQLPIPHQYKKKMFNEYHEILKRERTLLEKCIKYYGPFQNVSIINHSKNYSSNKCTYCKNYVHLSSIKCLDCKQNLCEWHVSKCYCINKKWTLVIRELNNDRQSLVNIVPMLKSQKIE